MKDKSIDLISAGHICLDITPQFLDPSSDRSPAQLLRPGNLSVVGPAAITTGGAAANVAVCAQKLGLAVALMGKCGDDILGRTLMEILRDLSPECAAGMRVAAGEHTSYTIVIAVPGTDRIFLHCPGANDTFAADDVDLELVANARLFYLGYPPLMARMCADAGAELAKLFAAVKGRGITTALDMALPDPSGPAGRTDWPALLEKTLAHVDLFVPSVEELTFMLRPERYAQLTDGGDILDRLSASLLRELSAACLAWGPAAVMIKCGRQGLYVRSGPAERIAAMGSAAPDPAGWADRELFAPAYQVPRVVSATGSGDAAVAGFLAAVRRGADLPTAADYACATGAQNVQAVDAASGLRDWAQTTAQLDGPRIKPPVSLDA